ncbi:MAG TPA: hypothetical protein P5081_14565 [Phycisphaerae bacterium]|nr:hypothetical protein [Phycisphaerae bacterium]HRW54093.1 hypothetical protein [Phycisphaerae bacterium]
MATRTGPAISTSGEGRRLHDGVIPGGGDNLRDCYTLDCIKEKIKPAGAGPRTRFKTP